MSNDIKVTWQEPIVQRHDRERLNGHKGCVLWFTGLSASGKSTVANMVDYKLHKRGVHSYLLDGDNVRYGLNASPERLGGHHGEKFSQRFGLGFSAEDREENIRRIGSVAQLFCNSGLVILAAFISPYRRDRDAIRATLADGDFIEILLDTPIEECEKRDPKGLYKRARAGELRGLTGIDDPYERPIRAELILDGGNKDPHTLSDEVMAFLENKEII